MTSVRNEDPRVDRLIAEVQELTSVLKVLVDTIPQRNKIWLTPSQFGKLLGVQYRQIARYREQGVFKESSYRRNGNRFEYHSVNAMKDAEAWQGSKVLHPNNHANFRAKYDKK